MRQKGARFPILFPISRLACDTLLTTHATPNPSAAPRTNRIGRRGVAGLLLLSLTAATVALASPPAAIAAQTVSPSAVSIAADPLRVQAEDYTSDNGNGLKKETGSDATGAPLGNVGGTWDGGELTYDRIDFGAAALSALTVRYVNNSGRVGANPSLDFYIDDKTEANKIATAALPVTGSNWQSFTTTTVKLATDVSGAHKLIVVMHVTADAGHPFAGNFDYFEFAAAALPEPAKATISNLVLGVGATEADRNLAWYSDLDVPQVAQFAKASEVVDGVFPASARTTPTTKTGGTTSGEFFRDAALDGLEENTEYAYRVGSDDTGWSDVYTFRTQASSGDFSFLFFGDPQLGASGNEVSDAAGWKDTLDVATKSYPNAELLFSAGDQVEKASSESQYDLFLQSDLLREVPLVATNGNHDVSSKAYEQHFNLPNEDLTAGAGTDVASGGDYWFIYKDVLFMNINSNSRDYSSHFAWMDQVVAEQGPKAKWKALAFHHSIYSVGVHQDDGDIDERRKTMPQKISELGIDLVLMGHDHNYARTYLIKNGQRADEKEAPAAVKVEAKEGEVMYVTANSSSGSKYYDTENPGAWWASVWNQEKVRNYTVLEVTDDEIAVRTLRSQQSGNEKPVNSVVDEVTLTKDAAPELTVPADGEIAQNTDFDPLEGVAASDNVDGDLTAEIEVSGSVDTTKPGAYSLSYSVHDGRGNVTTAERAVTVAVAPGPDEPGTEDPGTDEPGTDAPGAGAPGAGAPGAGAGAGTAGSGASDPSTADRLAKTGADAAALGSVGVLAALLLAIGAALLVTRRKRVSDR